MLVGRGSRPLKKVQANKVRQKVARSNPDNRCDEGEAGEVNIGCSQMTDLCFMGYGRPQIARIIRKNWCLSVKPVSSNEWISG